MKRFAALLVLLLFCASVASAQVSKQYVKHLSGVPTSCPVGTVTVNDLTGDTYTNKTGTGCVKSGTVGAGAPGGSDTQVQFNDGGSAFGGNAAFIFNKTTKVAIETNAGIGATSADGLVLQNTTAAANGAQQWSPRLRFTGFAWRTVGSQSHEVDWIVENQAVQGSTTPAGKLVFSWQRNAGGYTQQLILDPINGPTLPTLATGGANEFVTVDIAGVLGRAASSGISNSAPLGTIPKSIDGGGNLGPSQITDDGTDVGIVTGGAFSILSVNSSTLTVNNNADLSLGAGASVNVTLSSPGNSNSVSTSASTESVTVDGSTHTITNVAATAIAFNAPSVTINGNQVATVGVVGTVLSVLSDNATLATATGTTFSSPGYGGTPLAATSEAAVGWVCPRAGTISTLYVITGSVAKVNTPTTVITIRKSGVDTAVTLTLTQTTATVSSDLAHSFSVAAGDIITASFATTGVAGVSTSIAGVSFVLN